MSVRVATCIGCGCDDRHACLDAFDEPCGWLLVDRRERRGVCSCCPTHLPRWNRGERGLSGKAVNALRQRGAGENTTAVR